jgi:DNA-binding transcriptional regulator YhcF (GntR family)
MVSWAINERFDVKQQVMLAICHDIARGAASPGDPVLSPQELSEKRLLNPHFVEAAYEKLVETGILAIQPGGDYQVPANAPEKARQYLIQWGQQEIRDLVNMLQSAGFSKQEIQIVFREVEDA